jgi:hypothetical protein
MKNIPAIKQYFESGKHGRRVTMDELKALSKDERNELGALCCVELGTKHEPSPIV